MNVNLYNLARNTFQIVGQLIVQPRRDLQRSVDVLCKTMAFGHHGDNTICFLTFSALNESVKSQTPLGIGQGLTWTKFAKLIGESCDELQEKFEGNDKAVLANLAIISASIYNIASKNPHLENEMISIGSGHELNAGGVLTFIQSASSALQFKQGMYSQTAQRKRLVQ